MTNPLSEKRESGLPGAGKLTDSDLPKKRNVKYTGPKVRKEVIWEELQEARAELEELKKGTDSAGTDVEIDPKLWIPLWQGVGAMLTTITKIDFNFDRNEAEQLGSVTGPLVDKYFGSWAGDNPELASFVMVAGIISYSKVSAHYAKATTARQTPGSIDNNGNDGPGENVSNKANIDAPQTGDNSRL